MQEPCLKFCPSPAFALIQRTLASGDALAILADPSIVSQLFGPAVADVFQEESLCSKQQMSLVLNWIFQQAERCAQSLLDHPLKLLPSLRSDESENSTSHLALSTSQCCQLLCGMFLDCFDGDSRPAHGKWCPAAFSRMRAGSAWLPSRTTLHCVLQYFVTVQASLSTGQPLLSDACFIVLQRCAIGSSSSMRRCDSWAKMHLPLCHIVVSRGSLEPRIEDGHVVVDFANKMIGGGVLSGGCVQEEIMFSKRPEAIVSCLLCEIMYAPNRAIH
jgi:hypothetical protein